MHGRLCLPVSAMVVFSMATTSAAEVRNPPYHFDNSVEGWTAGSCVTGPWHTSDGWPGILYLDQICDDAYILGPATNFTGGANQVARVRVLKPTSGTHDMQLYWTSAAYPNWSEANSSGVVFYSGPEGWANVCLPLDTSRWVGQNITRLRLDFDTINAGHRWHVDPIVIETNDRLPPLSKPGEGAYVSGGFIFPLDDKPTPESHASTIAETPSGLVASWFGGTKEGNPDVGIWVSYHDGKRWSRAVEVANGVQSPEKRYPCWNPVLFQPRSGPLMLFYKVGGGPNGWWGMLMTSSDGGRSWSEPRRLGTGRLGDLVGPDKNKPVQLDDNSILCVSSRKRRVHFELTRDLGKTWEVIGPIDDSQQLGGLQPSILTYADGRMQVLCRSSTLITQSWSGDGGKSWSVITPTDLPNPDAGTDAVTLRDGRQLLVYNHTIRQPAGNFPRGRDMLNVAISKDGRDWKPALTLERREVRHGFAYPAVVQASDGKVHITYTYVRQSIKHVVLDPAKIE